MMKRFSSNYIPALNAKLVAKALPRTLQYLSIAACISLFSTAANAEYKYIYTGKALGGTIVLPTDPPIPPGTSPLADSDFFNLEVITDQPLQAKNYTAGTDIRYILKVGTYTFDSDSGVSSSSLDFRGVEENGTPYTWWIEAYTPTYSFKSIFTFFAEDGIMIIKDGNTYYSTNQGLPGTWQLATASPVAEPESFAMMLAGMGLISFAARRRHATLSSPQSSTVS